mmetsp:Transcript_24077/g.77317  ORF Transcript_24077/g.77317 Transcript_24077/m.77317 type:complete len:213 (+) Transcript_24077:27-665(+)
MTPNSQLIQSHEQPFHGHVDVAAGCLQCAQILGPVRETHAHQLVHLGLQLAFVLATASALLSSWCWCWCWCRCRCRCRCRNRCWCCPHHAQKVICKSRCVRCTRCRPTWRWDPHAKRPAALRSHAHAALAHGAQHASQGEGRHSRGAATDATHGALELQHALQHGRVHHARQSGGVVQHVSQHGVGRCCLLEKGVLTHDLAHHLRIRRQLAH